LCVPIKRNRSFFSKAWRAAAFADNSVVFVTRLADQFDEFVEDCASCASISSSALMMPV
jgi:hypothetical protein